MNSQLQNKPLFQYNMVYSTIKEVGSQWLDPISTGPKNNNKKQKTKKNKTLLIICCLKGKRTTLTEKF